MRYARAQTLARSIGFCAIWACISPSSTHHALYHTPCSTPCGICRVWVCWVWVVYGVTSYLQARNYRSLSLFLLPLLQSVWRGSVVRRTRRCCSSLPRALVDSGTRCRGTPHPLSSMSKPLLPLAAHPLAQSSTRPFFFLDFGWLLLLGGARSISETPQRGGQKVRAQRSVVHCC